MLFILVAQVSALTQLNIYLDEKGNAQFLGESSDNVILPQGVTLESGQIRGTTSILTSKQGMRWRFSYLLENSEMVIYLPAGSVVDNYNGGELFVDKGNIAIYAKNNIDVNYQIKEKAGWNSYVWVPIVLVAFAIAGYIYYFYNKTKKGEIFKKYDKTKGVKKELIDRTALLRGVLNEREQIILDKLKELGKTKMSNVRKQCEIPKAAFSRHIHQLRKKDLVKISGEGRNKFVELVN